MKDKLDCQDVSRLLSDGLDKALPNEERALLRLHLVVCEACRNVEQQLALMREALRLLGRADDKGNKSKDS